jgi:hypothetical protein
VVQAKSQEHVPSRLENRSLGRPDVGDAARAPADHAAPATSGDANGRAQTERQEHETDRHGHTLGRFSKTGLKPRKADEHPP